jgi:hypothetical protein
MVPAGGTAGDPTPGGGTGGGAVVDVYDSNGSGEHVEVTLPAAGWSAIGDTTTPRGYKYKSASATDAITRVVVRANQLRVRGGKANWLYTLAAPSQGRVAVRVTLGSGVQWCADTGPKSPASENDRVDKFIGAKRTPPPVACPAMP